MAIASAIVFAAVWTAAADDAGIGIVAAENLNPP
jgi:hypothetical protein